MEGGRATLVHQQRIGTPVDEGAHRARASRPHRAMQWRYTALVERVRVGASIDEVRDHLALWNRLPVVWVRASIGSVVKGFGAPSVAGANHGALSDQCLGELSVMGGRG